MTCRFSEFSEGVYIMKVFSPLEGHMKFVLYAKVHIVTKQILSHNPGNPTQTTLLHSTGFSEAAMGYTILINIHYYMYICNILKITKRSREIFAMGENGEILSLLRFARNDRKLDREPSRTYTDIHETTLWPGSPEPGTAPMGLEAPSACRNDRNGEMR
jgi:hypothetical protein